MPGLKLRTVWAVTRVVIISTPILQKRKLSLREVNEAAGVTQRRCRRDRAWGGTVSGSRRESGTLGPPSSLLLTLWLG